jgi:D-alanyl-D-alanine carboxypeptidase
MPEASHTLVAAVRRNNHTLISVVLYTFADTPAASAQESRKLFDWGFKNVKWGDEENQYQETQEYDSGTVETSATESVE